MRSYSQEMRSLEPVEELHPSNVIEVERVQIGREGHSTEEPNAIAALRCSAQHRARIYTCGARPAAVPDAEEPSRSISVAPRRSADFSFWRVLIPISDNRSLQLGYAGLKPGARAEAKVDGLSRIPQSGQEH